MSINKFLRTLKSSKEERNKNLTCLIQKSRGPSRLRTLYFPKWQIISNNLLTMKISKELTLKDSILLILVEMAEFLKLISIIHSKRIYYLIEIMINYFKTLVIGNSWVISRQQVPTKDQKEEIDIIMDLPATENTIINTNPI